MKETTGRKRPRDKMKLLQEAIKESEEKSQSLKKIKQEEKVRKRNICRWYGEFDVLRGNR